MASSVTTLTVLPTARPWDFAAIALNEGPAFTQVGYNVNFTDGTSGGGTGTQNQSFAYGQSLSGSTSPHTVAVTPGAVCILQYTGGSAKWFASGTFYGPSGDTSGSAHTSPSVDWTDAQGCVQPTDCMPAAHNIAGLDPTTGTIGLLGVFTDGSGNAIDKSFWDWKNNVILTQGFILTAAQPTGTTFPITITGTSYSGSTLVVTGAWLGGAGNAYKGLTFVTSGYTGSSAVNNAPGGLVCSASAAGSISLTLVGGFNGQTGSPVADPGTGAVTLYTGTITGGAANAFSGNVFTITGFDVSSINGTFQCVASTATTLTLQNTFNSQTLDTHAGNAVGAQAITLLAPAGAAFLSIGIDDDFFNDNAGHGFDLTISVPDTGGRPTADQTFPTRYPIGIACPINSADLMKPAVFMEASFHPLMDTTLNGWMSGYFGQLFPHGAQNCGGAPAGSNGQNFPY